MYRVKKISWRRAWQPIQYSYLENLMDRGAWQTTVHTVSKSWTQLKQHSMHILLYGCVIILFNQFPIVRL